MTASPGDGEQAAREGYYPDPSIPGYVRYWNGASWVPGTSRPAAPAAPAAPAEETGPVFLDETSATEALPEPEAAEPAPRPGPGSGLRSGPGPGPDAGAGSGPGSGGPGSGPGSGGPGSEPALWQADPLHQAGFGGPRDERVSWGSPAEPEAGHAAARPAGISLARTAAAAAAPATRFPDRAPAGILSARSPAAAAPAPVWPEEPARAAAAPAPAWPDAPGGPGGAGSGLTSSWPEAAPRAATAPARAPEAEAEAADEFEDWMRRGPVPGSRTAVRPPEPAAARPAPAEPAAPRPAPAPAPAPAPSAEPAAPRAEVWAPRPAGVRPSVPEAVAAAAGAAAAPVPVPAARPESTARAVFERMAERAVRPAGLLRRGVARLLDSLVLGAVAAGAAWVQLPAATAHIQAKVDAARGSGRATTVWLLDSTVAGHLGLVLAAVLLFGVFYEALPTARWGRTPGKKLLGVRVLATATLRPPTFGAALRRWLVYAVLGLPGSLWCLVDRPRRQAWHDKAARTYVAR